MYLLIKCDDLWTIVGVELFDIENDDTLMLRV